MDSALLQFHVVIAAAQFSSKAENPPFWLVPAMYMKGCVLRSAANVWDPASN